jgi:zinc/manganese transport system substrate-binding protein
MRTIPISIRAVAALSVLFLSACGSAATDEPTTTSTASEPLPVVAVTYSVLGSIVSDLVGDVANVVVVIPDGQDPHDYQPSAKDVESVLEGAERAGVTVFHMADHVTVRDPDSGEHEHDHHEGDDHSDDHGGEGGGVAHEGGHHDHDGDPHLWTSPATLLEALPALAAALETALGTPTALDEVTAALEAVDAEVAARIGTLESCVLVTGHDELGYFADRYGCEVVGTIIPSMSTTAEASAKQLAELKAEIAEHGARAIFTSLGTPRDVAERIASETGVKVVELATHMLGTNTSYADYILEVTDTIVAALS